MFFSRIELKRDDVNVAKILQRVRGDDYHHHQLIWELFQGVEQRDFLYRSDFMGNWPRYYAVSERSPKDDHSEWRVDTKEYRPVLTKGDRLAFDVRVNPIVTRKDKSGKQKRHDIVMDYKRSNKYRDLPANERPIMADIISESGKDWLTRRSTKHGFSTESDNLAVDRYESHVSYKRNSNNPVRYHTLNFSGLLTVTDPSAFLKMLYTGIGPAKGFGCGLMMVRRGDR